MSYAPFFTVEDPGHSATRESEQEELDLDRVVEATMGFIFRCKDGAHLEAVRPNLMMFILEKLVYYRDRYIMVL